MSGAAAIDSHQPYAVLKLRNFRLYLLARMCMTVAIQMQAVIVGWQIYSFTHDAFSLGLIGLAEAIPFIITSLFAGHVADIIPRKKVITSFMLLLMLCSGSLFLFSLNADGLLSRFNTAPIFAVIFLIGITRGFLTPAITAFFAQIISKDKYASGITWNSNVWQFASVAGPAIGGLIYGFAGITVAYGAVCLFLIFSFTCFLLIPSVPLPPYDASETLYARLTAGIRFVFNNQVVLGALSLDLFAVLFGGAVAMLPVFAADILKVGPEGLGALRAAPFAGSVIIGLFAAHRPPMKHAGTNLMLCITGFGVCTILFALSTNFYLSLFLLLLTGAFDNISVIVRSTILQLTTPDHMRGRVSAVNNIFIGSSNEIGAFESGTAARLLGLIPSVIFGGVMTIGIVVFTAWWAPVLRRLNLRQIQAQLSGDV
ncbi:MAG: MFS transporter [Chitinophagales bacterium]|nr:MFS transporter [Chitinophagales bacterium]